MKYQRVAHAMRFFFLLSNECDCDIDWILVICRIEINEVCARHDWFERYLYSGCISLSICYNSSLSLPMKACYFWYVNYRYQWIVLMAWTRTLLLIKLNYLNEWTNWDYFHVLHFLCRFYHFQWDLYMFYRGVG